MSEHEAGLGQRMAKAAGWGGAGLFLSATASLGLLNQAETETTLGTHEVTISPTFDDHVTFEMDGVGKLRLPSDGQTSIGAYITVENSPNLRKNLQQDILIAANPDGEIAKLKDETEAMIIKSFAQGTLIGGIALGGVFLAKRRLSPEKQFRSDYLHTPQLVGGLVVGISVGLAMSQLGKDGNLHPDTETSWVQVTDQVTALKQVDNKMLQALQVEPGLVTDAFIEGANSMVDGYNKARTFYANLYDRFDTVAPKLNQPTDEQTVVLHVTDRHDNILMDKVLRKLGDAGGASVVLSTGDDTSSGLSVEAFSLNSLNQTFEGYDKIIAAGNHDYGNFVTDYLAERGWVVLNGAPEEVAGIRFLGDSDPRQSSVTVRMEGEDQLIEELGEQLASTACEDGDVSTIAVHDADAGTLAATSGCVELILAGHDHVQKGPTVLESVDDSRPVTLTTGTSGGATFAVAMSSKLKRNAQATLVTYEDGSPVGLQVVTFQTNGEIVVDPYWAMPGHETFLASDSQTKRSPKKIRN